MAGIRVGAVVGVAVLLSAALGCSSGSGSRAAPSTTSTTISRRQVEIAAATRVLESLRPGDPAGFDPAAWKDAVDPLAVLPRGAKVSVRADSWVMEGAEASADVMVSAPGVPDQRHWVFLRKNHGHWVVYGTLPLEVSP